MGNARCFSCLPGELCPNHDPAPCSKLDSKSLAVNHEEEKRDHRVPLLSRGMVWDSAGCSHAPCTTEAAVFHERRQGHRRLTGAFTAWCQVRPCWGPERIRFSSCSLQEYPGQGREGCVPRSHHGVQETWHHRNPEGKPASSRRPTPGQGAGGSEPDRGEEDRNCREHQWVT